eukprot:CAMPEP_0198223366 /NCGR_PEP_ID=MMETSP1445-20131203/92292_1 /TAXON_ID=36898 /ORGANISM="Pyramimonas sp., Strain CCMP2087" /LENGTH=86 /DNA_ID=CAMNT_0043902187 /DNA_START=203 /DNA_END=460 /DNA_ORIENTATION=+
MLARYAAAMSATALVACSELSRGRKLSGAAASIEIKIHTSRRSNSGAQPKYCAIPGIWSPTTIKYEVATPKHLIATAASIARTARG